MKLFEVFDKETSTDNWQSDRFGRMGEVHYTEIGNETVHVEFYHLDDLLSYFQAMEAHGMVTDADTVLQSTLEEVPELKEWGNIVNVGFGVNGSPETRQWPDLRTVYELLSSIVHLVLKHSREHSERKYVFGSKDHKKALMFYKMIRKYTKNVYLVKNPEASNNHTFIFAHA